MAASGDDEQGSRRAFSELCQIYWFPIYCYIRGRGKGAQDAEDLTQDFFAALIQRDSLSNVDAGHGKLRAYLLASVKNLLASSHRRETSLKRGGGNHQISIDAAQAEGHLSLEPVDSITPEAIYERAWLSLQLERVRSQLADSYKRAKKENLFEAISPYIHESGEEPSYLELAARLGMGAGSLRVAVFRLRQKFRELLEAEIVDTLDDCSELEGEISYLMGLFAG